MSALFNFFYLYDPWIAHFVRMSIVAGTLSALILFWRWYKKSQSQLIIPIDSLLALLALIMFSVIPLLINGTSEMGVIKMYGKGLVLFCLGIFVYNLFYAHDNGKLQFVSDVKIGISLQFIVGLLAIIGIPFMLEITTGTNASYFLPRFIGSEQEYRLYNFTSSAFFQLSAFYVLLLHFLLAYGADKSQEVKIEGWVIFCLLCIGLISGRTFLLLSAVSILFYFKRHYIFPLCLFALLIIMLAIILPEHKFVAHALEPLINLFKQTEIIEGTAISLSSSTDTLMNKHLFMPELKQLLLGDGLYYAQGLNQDNALSYYGGSDSGFIRQALYGGIGYMLICFAITAYFVKRVADNWFSGSWKFIISTLLLLTIMNIKADTYAYSGIMWVLLIFLSLFGEKGKQLILKR